MGGYLSTKRKLLQGFTYRYNIDQLLYYEDYGDVNMAISREKEIKNWRREKKLHLISRSNPKFSDLAEDWY